MRRFVSTSGLRAAETARRVKEGQDGAAPKSKVYTRTGDQGTTSLFNGSRRPKDDHVFAVLGSIDEANARVGLAREHVENPQRKTELEAIQHTLFDAGAAVATPLDSSSKQKQSIVSFRTEKIQQLEKWIDEMDQDLPKLNQFILPGGGVASAHVHMARTAVRHAERIMYPLVRESQLNGEVAIYFNRLSDYLFVAARYVAHSTKHQDLIYRKDVSD
mmetsp:Transcript_24829/g.98132  ORF Transcript_24829/g.98132 Transcript_24829/m.98132 type:complete len:217 (-) Transcript_24829:1628-2278(-)